jgi:hypothetical protein
VPENLWTPAAVRGLLLEQIRLLPPGRSRCHRRPTWTRNLPSHATLTPKALDGFRLSTAVGLKANQRQQKALSVTRWPW